MQPPCPRTAAVIRGSSTNSGSGSTEFAALIRIPALGASSRRQELSCVRWVQEDMLFESDLPNRKGIDEMKMSRKAALVALTLVSFLALAGTQACAQWYGSYGYNSPWANGAVGAGYNSPQSWSHTGLAWGSAGWAGNNTYGIGIGGGVGPTGGGSIGVKVPAVGEYQFNW